MKLRDYCIGCRKYRWFAKVRDYLLKPANTIIKSQGALCRKCYKIIQKAK